MLRAGFALWFGMAMMPQAWPQSMPEAAAQLAGRISSLLPRRATVSLDFQNLAALPAAESSSFRIALEQELRKMGLEPAPAAQPETHLRVTISENVRGLLFVAATGPTENPQVAMLPWIAPVPVDRKPRVKITAQPLISQTEPVLDILLLDSGSRLLALMPGKISSYRLLAGKWTLAAVAGIPIIDPLPRDTRGRLESDAAAIHVYLAGITCNSPVQGDLRLSCSAAADGWPLNPRDPSLVVRWLADRNLLQSDAMKDPFYSAAAGWFAMTAGRVQDRSGEPLKNADGWGSDLAGIEDPCRSAWLILADKDGDAGERDQIQAFSVVDNQATELSDSLSFPGPVTALWPAENPAQATAVIRNSKTGNYEASRLALACLE